MDGPVLALPMRACALLLAGVACTCAFADDRRPPVRASGGSQQSAALRADGAGVAQAVDPIRAARFGLTIDGYEIAGGKGHEEEIELFTVNWGKPAQGSVAPGIDAGRLAAAPPAGGPGTLTVTMRRQHANGLRAAFAHQRVLPRIVLSIPPQDGRPRTLATLHQVTIAAVRPASVRGAAVGPADEIAFVYQRIETD